MADKTLDQGPQEVPQQLKTLAAAPWDPSEGSNTFWPPRASKPAHVHQAGTYMHSE